MNIRFNAYTQQYERKGKKITEKDLQKLNERRSTALLKTLNDITFKYNSGLIDIDTWEKQFRSAVVQAHIQQYTLGVGGKNNLNEIDRLRLAQEIDFQKGRVSALKQDILRGQSKQRIAYRNQMFSTSIKGSFELGKTAAHSRAGFTLERRIRTATESCQACIFYASVGWVVIGTLPAPTKRCECRANCKCYKIFSRGLQQNPLSIGFGRERFKRSDGSRYRAF